MIGESVNGENVSGKKDFSYYLDNIYRNKNIVHGITIYGGNLISGSFIHGKKICID